MQEGVCDLVYDPIIGYAEQVIAFAKSNRTYGGNPEYYEDTCNTVRMIEDGTYSVDKNYLWYVWLRTNLRTMAKIRRDKDKIEQSLALNVGSYIFLTVGFDDKSTVDGNSMMTVADQINRLNGGRFVKKSDYVLEKHRTDKDGNIYIHHHIHMLIVTNETLRVSKIVELIWKLKGLKKIVKDKNFIDVKTPSAKQFDKKAQPYPVCLQYVQGIKTTLKTKCLELDTAWRDSIGVPHYPTYVSTPTPNT